ncbi:PREDICTED: alpha-1B-glycoprotein isoform X2 [Cercocebus atys]|uniref:alpha-1B-glycoprotein isoform X2 n=1 Tax=Cercocebus atys TaxID=9531 RepID=UPI0005F4E338|nr:PREDICTED: alpha-1B-glycoprotein isoform X2 [Cercocebus atys]
MSMLVAFLLFWGLPMGPVTEAATFYETQPSLWAESESLLKPSANVMLTCQARLGTPDFQLFKNGVAQEPVHLDSPAIKHQFLLTGDTRGRYRCRSGLFTRWTQLSKLLELTGPTAPPPPVLMHRGESAQVLRPGNKVTLACVAPLSGVHFQLWRGEKELLVPGSSTSPDRIFFHLNAVALGDGGHYTCRYRLHDNENAWSGDSAPVELILSDETLPAPEFTAEPSSRNPEPGTRVRLRCLAPLEGARFALVREDGGGHRVLRFQSPAGTEALFELHNISVADSANYSCVYVDLKPPFGGSAPSEHLELRVDGPPPRPQLRAAWSGAVLAGRDAVLRCEGPIPDVTFELLREGETKAVDTVRTPEAAANLELTFVGPQHAGSYRCRYRSWGPNTFESELSDPVELLVAES